jgi:hypothetical protein
MGIVLITIGVCTNNVTTDNRLVLKEMVSSWNVAERDALLRFAPKYFTYLKTSAGVSDFYADSYACTCIIGDHKANNLRTLKHHISF